MDLDTAKAFLRSNHRSILCTFRRDGQPQLSPVVHAVDNDGHVLISSGETRVKVRNLRRDPRVVLCAISDQFFGPWVQAEGRADIVSLPGAMDALIDYYRRVAGEHPDWDDYRRAMVTEKRCVIRVALEKAGPQQTR